MAGSHSRTVPSWLALASRRPSGENATRSFVGVAFQGGGGLAGGRVPQPHRAVAPALASSRPSGENATPLIQSGVAFAGTVELAGRWPGPTAAPRRRAGAGQQAARPARTPPSDPAGVAFQGGDGLAGGRVPQPHRAVAAGAGQQAPVRGEHHAVDPERYGLRGWRRAGRWPGPTAAPCRRRPRWPAAARPGENATPVTSSVWPSRVAAGWPVAGSHSRTVPSLPALASRRPSGENATERDPPVWPAGCAVGWPVTGSHSRTVPSSPALASSRPSGENATVLTRPAWPSRVPWAGRWPGPTAAPCRRGRRWPAGARRARTPPRDPAGVAFQDGGGLAGGRVPQPHRAVVAGAGQQAPVGGERHAVDRAGVAFQDAGEAGLGGRQAPLRRQVARGEQVGQSSGSQ